MGITEITTIALIVLAVCSVFIVVKIHTGKPLKVTKEREGELCVRIASLRNIQHQIQASEDGLKAFKLSKARDRQLEELLEFLEMVDFSYIKFKENAEVIELAPFLQKDVQP